MVSASEGLIYYCTVFLTALVFLTEASAITTNYEKSNTQQNKTQEAQTLPSHQRTKSTPTRNRANLSSKHQNGDRVNSILLTKLKTNTKIEVDPQTELQIEETLLSSSSGGENEIKDKGGGNTVDDDDQKTLFQQVADGKYGLIQNELFATKPKRLGVISYDANPEVPKDNINNLGGLESEDIWLAENHLLVLAGSRLNDNSWIPIDNYVAPRRPVKIPPNPKVPPPFPVQLSENGPIEYINSVKQTQPSIGIFNPIHLPYANFNASKTDYISALYGKSPYGSPGNGLPARAPIKPLLPLNANPPPTLLANIKPPVGAEFIPPYLRVTNQSEIDEDDPSLYYPPPYDFYYPKDNTSKVPAGPLVPGIVMPPPPNFFSSFENETINYKQTFEPEPKLVKDKPHKSNLHKFGKQLQYVNNTRTILTPQRPQVSSTDTPPPPWQPNDFAIYNEISNDQMYPTSEEKIIHPSMKDDEANNQINWIPIPAPTPLYITETKKLIKNTNFGRTQPLKLPGYSYNRPGYTLTIPERQQKMKYVQQINEDDLPTTTPFIYSQIVSTQSPSSENEISSTTPVLPHKPSPTIKATYYFYEEPKFTSLEEPLKSLYTNTNSEPTIDTITKYREQLPKIHSNRAPSNEDRSKFDEKKRKPIAPLIPIYYLAELDNVVDFIKPVGQSESPHQSKSEYYTTTAKPTYTINKPHYEQPTPKPISEYSYVASNYNNPVNSIVHSTLSPLEPSNFNTPPPVPNYHFDFNNFYGQQQQQQLPRHPLVKYPMPSHYPMYQVPIQTTSTPVLFFDHVNQYSQVTKIPSYDYERPWIPNINLYSNDAYSAAYPTDNPYYAFFTKEDAELIDENTKKYFTIFGQKIKHSIESTSPLPVVQTIATPELGENGWNTKYRTYKKYPTQSLKNGYSVYSTTTTVPYETPTSTDQSESQILGTAISEPLYSSSGDNRDTDGTSLPLSNVDAEDLSSKLGKRIRPIVVQDLPADLNERLKNIMNLRNRENNFLNEQPNTSHSQFRYTLIDNSAYDNQPYRYPQFVLNKNLEGYRQPSYTEQQASTIVSLHGDTRVNDFKRRQKQSENPNAEYIRKSSENVVSLHGDTRVNDFKRRQKQPENADAEYIHESSENDLTAHKSDGDDPYEAEELSTPKLISLENDILVNYKKPHPTNLDAEYVTEGTRPRPRTSRPREYPYHENTPSYSRQHLRRDRFYFLTPTETRLTQIEDERYDSQSHVEKPSSYIKRVIEKPKTTKTACASASCSS